MAVGDRILPWGFHGEYGDAGKTEFSTYHTEITGQSDECGSCSGSVVRSCCCSRMNPSPKKKNVVTGQAKKNSGVEECIRKKNKDKHLVGTLVTCDYVQAIPKECLPSRVVG